MTRRMLTSAVVRTGVLLTALFGFDETTSAQSASSLFQAAVQVPMLSSGEFDSADVGIGGRLAWQPLGALGMEAEMNLYPRGFPDSLAISRSRWEGLFGVTAGVSLQRVRLFGKLRPGFVNFRAPNQQIACIAIYPPPLNCVLAAGRTLLALDAGGGVEWPANGSPFVRLDAGDRLIRYPGPAFSRDRRAHEGAFVGHDVRVALGAGVRF